MTAFAINTLIITAILLACLVFYGAMNCLLIYTDFRTRHTVNHAHNTKIYIRLGVTVILFWCVLVLVVITTLVNLLFFR